ncbi:hypothetical protein ARZXY2_3138 [Arthrobacter sp. ZXY-2]|nr:hypothetical protein ARZXY2_3138 [Arthrobacter sp. ZXY-2]
MHRALGSGAGLRALGSELWAAVWSVGRSGARVLRGRPHPFPPGAPLLRRHRTRSRTAPP